MTSSSTEPTNLREVRKFGLMAGIFFGCLLGISLWREKSALPLFFGTLCFLGWALLVLPKRLLPLYKGWNKVGQLIGKGITVILMTTAYYFVMTPAALIKRFFGGRPLPLLPDKDCSSYWVARTESIQPKERFLKHF